MELVEVPELLEFVAELLEDGLLELLELELELLVLDGVLELLLVEWLLEDELVEELLEQSWAAS